MIGRLDAAKRATAHVDARGGSRVIDSDTAKRNTLDGLWVFGVQEPEHADGPVDGGSLLVVPDDGRPYEVAAVPTTPEWSGAQAPAELAGLPSDWGEVLSDYVDDGAWWRVIDGLAVARSEGEVFPPEQEVFAAFSHTPYDDVRVVLLGQDPYPKYGEAHGLCFSVPPGVTRPQSLIKIHRLLSSDLGIKTPADGSLVGWAEQGVLLLNTALTVAAGDAGSHAVLWAEITDSVIRAVSERPGPPVVFVLWGGPANKKATLIDERHPIVRASHPVAYANAKVPFLESRSFSRVNEHLTSSGQQPIDWARTSTMKNER